MYDFKTVDYHKDTDHQDLVDLVKQQYPNDNIVPSSPKVIGARSKNIQVWNNEDLIKAYTFSKLTKNVEIMTDGFAYLGHDKLRSMNNPILFLIDPGTIIPINKFYDFRWNAFLAYFAEDNYDYDSNLIWTYGNPSDNYTCTGTFKPSVISTTSFDCPVRENCKRYVTTPNNLTKISYYTCKQQAIYTQFINKYYPVKTADYIRTNNKSTMLLSSDTSNFNPCSELSTPRDNTLKLLRRPSRNNTTKLIINNIPMVYPDGKWWKVGLELEKQYT